MKEPGYLEESLLSLVLRINNFHIIMMDKQMTYLPRNFDGSGRHTGSPTVHGVTIPGTQNEHCPIAPITLA